MRRDNVEEKKVSLKQHIYKCALEIMDSKGFRATTLREIAQAAGVSRSTLHQYFPSKDDFIFEWGRCRLRLRNALLEQFPEEMSTRACIEYMFRISAQDVQEHPKMAKFQRYATYKAETLHRQAVLQEKGLIQVYAKLLERGIARGEFRSDIDCVQVAQLLVFNFFEAQEKYFWDPEPGEWEMVDYLVDSLNVITEGIRC